MLERAYPPAMSARAGLIRLTRLPRLILPAVLTRLTRLTRLAAGFTGSVFAIDRARKLDGQRLGAHAGWSGEQVPVGQAVLLYGLHEPLPLPVVSYNAIESHNDSSSVGADHIVDPVGSLRRFLESETVECTEHAIARLPADLRQPGHGIDPLFVAFTGGKPLSAAVEG